MLVKKSKDKKRKLYHFKDLINDFNYYDFSRYSIPEKGYNFKGYIYTLDRPDMKKLETVYKNYENTLTLHGYSEYAPEIKKAYIFIAD